MLWLVGAVGVEPPAVVVVVEVVSMRLGAILRFDKGVIVRLLLVVDCILVLVLLLIEVVCAVSNDLPFAGVVDAATFSFCCAV